MATGLGDEWWDVRFALEEALARATEPGQFVLIEEEQPTDDRRRYVQALRLDDGMRLECVGPLSAAPKESGLWPMNDETVDRLASYSWSRADDDEYPNLWRLRPSGYIGETAAVMAEALFLLGCEAGGGWTVTVDRLIGT